LEIKKGLEQVYVVPEISQKDTENEYLTLLYAPIMKNVEKHKIRVSSLSISQYPKMVVKKITGEKSIYHHHWYHLNEFRNIFYFFWRTYWILLFRIIGGKVVWTIHNIAPHHGKFKFFNIFFRKFLAFISNKLHVHCNEAITIMSKKLSVRRKKFFVVEHPPYSAKEMSRDVALKQLNEKYVNNTLEKEDLVFLSFGLIGKYKKIKETIEIFKNYSSKKKLIIAGKGRKTESDYLEEIIELAEKNDNIILINQAIPNEDIPIFFSSTDYLILNYEHVLTSGVLHLGLSYNRKILAVDKGCISGEKDDKIIRFKDEVQLKEIVDSLEK
jgi:glycosyltransferase involved in cell wall biosynthesis